MVFKENALIKIDRHGLRNNCIALITLAANEAPR